MPPRCLRSLKSGSKQRFRCFAFLSSTFGSSSFVRGSISRVTPRGAKYKLPSMMFFEGLPQISAIFLRKISQRIDINIIFSYERQSFYHYRSKLRYGQGNGPILGGEKSCHGPNILVSRTQAKLAETAAEVKALCPEMRTLVVTADVSSDADNKKMVDETVKSFGGVHGAFLNAGSFVGGKPIHETPDYLLDAAVNTNMKSVVYALRHLIPAVKATVGEEGPAGSIVVNSSCMAQAVIGPKSAGAGLYSASKAFLNSLVETAAIENAPRIRVNGVMPGVVHTNIMGGADESTYDAVAMKVQSLWQRAGKPREVASLVSYLLSDEASFISGSNMMVDGLWSKVGGSFT